MLINVPLGLFNTIIAHVKSTLTNSLKNSRWPDFYWYLVWGITLQLIATILLFAAALKDPGIIPATFISPYAEARIDKRYLNIKRKNQRLQYPIVLNEQMSRIKFCETCMIFRPKQSAHCNLCDNCVLGFDHHCVWLGTCVGRRNYKEFLAFVTSINVVVVFVIYVCVWLLR